MDYILAANATVFVHSQFAKSNVFIANGMIREISNRTPQADCSVYDLNARFIFPGFIDVHVHLRDPGFFYKHHCAGELPAVALMAWLYYCPRSAERNLVPDCR